MNRQHILLGMSVCLFVAVLFVVHSDTERHSAADITLESDGDWAPSFNLMEQMDVGTFAADSEDEETELAEFDTNDDNSVEDEVEDAVASAHEQAEQAKEEEEEEVDAASMLHPHVEGDGRKVKSNKPHKIVHVGALASNLDLLGVSSPHKSAKKKKKKTVLATPGKAAEATFLPSYVKDNLLDVNADIKTTVKSKGVPKKVKKAKKHVMPPSALKDLLSRSKKKDHKAGKFDNLAELEANLKKKYVKTVEDKKEKLDAKAKHAAHRLEVLRKWLDHNEADAQGHTKRRVKAANKAAASWLLEKDKKGAELSLMHLHELIHWHQVAQEGGIKPEEIKKMVDHANKKKLSQTTVVEQVTSANAKAAAFSALKKKTTSTTEAQKRLKVAKNAVADVVASARAGLDHDHRLRVIKVANKKIATLLELQHSLETRLEDSFGLAAVRGGNFCVLKWYKTVLGAGCDLADEVEEVEDYRDVDDYQGDN